MAPEMPVRMPRSETPRSAAPSAMRSNSGGTAITRVGVLRLTASRISPVSGFGIRCTMAPAVSPAFIESEQPKTWKSGRQARKTSCPGTIVVTQVIAWVVDASRLVWVRGTPFGVPVVPEVYSNNAKSSACGRRRRGAGAPGRSSSSKATVPVAGCDSCARLARALAIGSLSSRRLLSGIASIRLIEMMVSGRTSSGSACRLWAAASQTMAILAWWSPNSGVSSRTV